MKKKIIPNYIMQHFQRNPKIGRTELAKAANIPETEARFYCRVFKEMNSGIKPNSRGVALFDIHYPVHDKASMEIVFQFLQDYQPDYLVLGGDQLHMDTISSWNARKPKLLEGKRLKREYDGFQTEILDRLEAILKPTCKKYFMIGNHEYRVQRYIEKNTQVEGFYEVERNLDLTGWTIIPFNEVFNIGDMYFAHGVFWNKYYAEKTVRIYQKMMFVGHVHIPQTYTAKSPAYALPKQAVGVGCLANVNPSYLEGKPNAWVHQFLFWHMFEDGTFTYYTPIIINGRAVINNKFYDGNEGRYDVYRVGQATTAST